MQVLPIVIDVVLGLAEFVVIDRALREWLGTKNWILTMLAACVPAIPALGGALALVGAIAILEWRWWLAGGLFVGGTVALALSAGIDSLWNPAALF
jgi:hypothetical protein